MRRLWRDPDLAIDMGTGHTRLLVPGAVLVELPSVDPVCGNRVVTQGVVIDEAAAARLARRLISPGHRSGRRRSRVIASCPMHLGHARGRLVRVLELAGADEVDVVRSTIAAAHGAAIDLASPYAEMLIDIGAGLTEIAVFRHSRMIEARTIPIGTRSFSRDAGPRNAGLVLEPEALADQVLLAWKSFPQDVQVEIIECGAVLTGGGAAIEEVVDALRRATRLTFRVPADPHQAVIRGLAELGLGARVVTFAGGPAAHDTSAAGYSSGGDS